MAPVLFVFLDGFGLGGSDPAVNPVAAADLATLSGLLGGRPPVRAAAPFYARGVALVGLDARLDVDGLPQSGTGHAALLTGENAPRLFGRHFGPWIPTALRPLLAERSVLARARRAGHRVAFANAYPRDLLAESMAGRPRGARRLARLPRAGPPLAALAAGLLTRDAAELARGEAVASEITNDAWREHLGHRELPRLGPEEAGRNLAGIAADYDLTFFAHYSLDTVGHRGTHAEAVAALERVDAFIAGALRHLRPDTLLVVASDHGNVEELGVGHTRNPALALVVGPDAESFARRLHALTDVTPAILDRLGA